MKQIAIIGAGNMGGAIARGMVRSGRREPSQLRVSNPSLPKLKKLQQDCPGIRTTTSNSEAVRGADAVVLAVKPWKVGPVLEELALQPGQCLISVAAGVTFDQLAAFAGRDDLPLFRLVPNTAILVGESMTLVAARGADAARVEEVLSLFAGMGNCLMVDEAQLGAGTSLASCGIAYVFQFVEAAVQAGVRMGLNPDAAREMVARTLCGAGALMLQPDADPGREIIRVCTPGGLTEKGIRSLREDGFPEAVIRAMIRSNPGYTEVF